MKRSLGTKKGFTLIELLVVVAIIGILAAVGVVAYNGYTQGAKRNASKANHKNVCKWVNAEIKKCEVGIDNILNGNITCTHIQSELSSTGNPIGDVARAIETALQDQFKNPFGAFTADYGDSAVRTSGWNKDRDLGYTIVGQRCCHGDEAYGLLNIHTCHQTPCDGDPMDEGWDNERKSICWIRVE